MRGLEEIYREKKSDTLRVTLLLVYPEVMHVLCQVWIGKGHDRKEEIKEE